MWWRRRCPARPRPSREPATSGAAASPPDDGGRRTRVTGSFRARPMDRYAGCVRFETFLPFVTLLPDHARGYHASLVVCVVRHAHGKQGEPLVPDALDDEKCEACSA